MTGVITRVIILPRITLQQMSALKLRELQPMTDKRVWGSGIGAIMVNMRNALPQHDGEIYLTDAGVETDLIFNHGIEIREFAAHTLLDDAIGLNALINYFTGFLELAREREVGFILDSQTWKAHSHWAHALGSSNEELQYANQRSLRVMSELRSTFSSNARPIVLNAVVGPRGDAYVSEHRWSVDDARKYHSKQMSWLSETEADMVTAMTFTSSDEASGLVMAAQDFGLPAVVSFTVETDGRLPSGETIQDAIQSVDCRTDASAEYFMVNCAHPTHFSHILRDADWARRIRGLRCNASAKSHAELDASEFLDDGDPFEMGHQNAALRAEMPWLHIFGGCCGSDLRHVTEIANALGI